LESAQQPYNAQRVLWGAEKLINVTTVCPQTQFGDIHADNTIDGLCDKADKTCMKAKPNPAAT